MIHGIRLYPSLPSAMLSIGIKGTVVEDGILYIAVGKSVEILVETIWLSFFVEYVEVGKNLSLSLFDKSFAQSNIPLFQSISSVSFMGKQPQRFYGLSNMNIKH